MGSNHHSLAYFSNRLYRDIALHMASHSGTYGQHCAQMNKDSEWIDASVLHALGCTYKVDIAVWQENQDPMIVGISLSTSAVKEIALINVAMVNDFHFWGLRALPQTLVEIPVPDNGDCMITSKTRKEHPKSLNIDSDGQHDPGSVGSADLVDGDDDLDGYDDLSWLRHNPDPRCMDADEMERELRLCNCLVKWDPWSEPTSEILSALQAIGPPSHGSVGCRCMLRTQVIEELSYELTAAADLPDEYKHFPGSKRRLQRNRPQLQAMYAGKKRQGFGKGALEHCNMLTECNIMSLDDLTSHLAKPCDLHETTHHCLDVFRENPRTVQNWRVLWRSLSAQMRQELLMRFMAQSLADHRNSGSFAGWQVKYRFLGQEVCKAAFMMLTGVGGSSINKARERALSGQQSVHSRQELGYDLLIVNTNLPKLHLDARSWLQNYACTHAEQSPISQQYCLPAGKKDLILLQTNSVLGKNLKRSVL